MDRRRFLHLAVGGAAAPLVARARASQAAGRVHFAGEHTSEWMEGALESAERAVKEVLSA